MASGKPQKQAVAIALNVARKAATSDRQPQYMGGSNKFNEQLGGYVNKKKPLAPRNMWSTMAKAGAKSVSNICVDITKNTAPGFKEIFKSPGEKNAHFSSEINGRPDIGGKKITY